MATMGQYTAETFTSGEAITKWNFVTLEADGKVDMADADAETVVGVALTDASTADKAVTVAKSGRVKVEAGGSITAGDEIVTNTSGKAVERSTSSSATAVTLGYALENAVVNQIFSMELIQGGKVTNEA